MPPMPPKDGSASLRATLITAPSTAPAAGEDRHFTWQEVAKHNTAASAWVIIDRRVYDITKFLPNHPGGQEMLLLSAGRECTDLFTMYHWWDDAAKARAIMAKYLVGHLAGPTEFPSYPSDTRGFYKTMSARVRAYFVRTGRDPKSPWAGLWRLAVIFAVAFTAYAIVNGRLLAGAPWAVLMLAAAVLGTFQAMPLMHAMHDAAHAAIGHNEVWWKVVGRGCLDVFAGGSMITWHHQHIIGHHVYTNVFKADPDIPCTDTGDLRFLSSAQVWSYLYRFQWLYLPVLYGFLGFLTRIQDVLATWWAETSGPIRVNFYGSAFVRVFLTKALWVTWRIAIPLAVWGVPASTFWPLFFIAEAATGYTLAWNFEVSHVASTVSWPEPDADNVLPVPWAESQVATGVDYAHHSPSAAWWSGALNYQIEHHLFPGISQYHYPAICDIVRQTSHEFGVPYRLEPSFWTAWSAHVRHLHDLGKKGKAHNWTD